MNDIDKNEKEENKIDIIDLVSTPIHIPMDIENNQNNEEMKEIVSDKNEKINPDNEKEKDNNILN